MSLKSIYGVLWLVWILSFFAIELSALWTGHNAYTLSAFTWRLEKLGGTWTFVRYFVAAFCLWLSAHLILGWFR